MAKVSFSKTVTVATPDPEVEVSCETGGTVEVLPPGTQGPGFAVPALRRTSGVAYFGDNEEDEADSSDVIIPRLNIVQKVGDLSNIYKAGEVVLNKSLVLPPPVELVVLGFRKTQFTEKVEGGEMGRLFDSEQEVAAAGGTVDYNEAKETDKPLFQRLATAMLAIKGDKSLDPTRFALVSPDGDRFVLALWSMKGSAYTNAAKVIKSHGKMEHLRSDENPRKADYTKAFYQLTTRMEKFKTGNYAAIPVMTVGKATTPEFREWIKGLVRG